MSKTVIALAICSLQDAVYSFNADAEKTTIGKPRSHNGDRNFPIFNIFNFGW